MLGEFGCTADNCTVYSLHRRRKKRYIDVEVSHGTYILDGHSEIVAHVWSELGYLICLRHSFSLRAVRNLNVSICIRHLFRSTAEKYSSHVRNVFDLPSYIRTMINGAFLKEGGRGGGNLTKTSKSIF